MSSCNSCSSSNKTLCPMRLSDGRFCTSYYSKCHTYSQFDNMLEKNNIPKSSYEIRQYLQKNALAVMDMQRIEGFRDVVGCLDCTGASPSTLLPERYVVKCNSVSCERKEVNPSGLGDGRLY
jgi:hypothetical protein